MLNKSVFLLKYIYELSVLSKRGLTPFFVATILAVNPRYSTNYKHKNKVKLPEITSN